MCVAIYKPKNIQTPSLETLKKCWDTNPDGAGFAILTGEKKYPIEIHKGFMTWESFLWAFEKYQLADFSGEMFLHFRITTHGGTSPGNTHPFSITKDIKILQYTNVLTNYALVHNGILPIEPENKGISDTMELCRRLAKGSFYQDVPAVFNLIKGMIGSNKIAVMTKDKVHLLGDWEIDNGVYFSNMLWDWQDFGFDDYGFEDDCHFIDSWNIQQLNDGYCPYCGGPVQKDDDSFYCFQCDDIWTERFQDEETVSNF